MNDYYRKLTNICVFLGVYGCLLSFLPIFDNNSNSFILDCILWLGCIDFYFNKKNRIQLKIKSTTFFKTKSEIK